MKPTNRPNLIFFLFVFFFFSSFSLTRKSDRLKVENGNTLTVIIKNIRNKDGRLQVDLYKNQEEFEVRASDDKRRAYVYKSSVSNGRIVHVYKNVPDGVYGLALFDDENKNGKIDYGWIMPKEGFGFGDYYHTKWSSPHFNDFKFSLKEDKTVVMVVRYL